MTLDLHLAKCDKRIMAVPGCLWVQKRPLPCLATYTFVFLACILASVQYAHLIGMLPFPSLPLLVVRLYDPFVQDGVILAHAVGAICSLCL